MRECFNVVINLHGPFKNKNSSYDDETTEQKKKKQMMKQFGFTFTTKKDGDEEFWFE